MAVKITIANAVLALGVVVVSGCAGFSGEAGDKPEGTRLIEGRLQVPDEDLLGRQVTGLQVAALHLDAEGGVTAFPSAVFDPSVQRSEASFVATVGGGVDVVLVLQVPSASQVGAGAFLGVFVSDDGTLVPRGEDDVNLGLVSVVTGQRKPADTTLSSAAATPAQQTDTDGDGLSNADDDDDDDDSIADANDPDVAGDGIDDAVQVLQALADADGDGVPDVLQQ